MAPLTDWQAWMLREIADLALSDPVRALEVIGPPARYLDGTYLRVACDLLEMAARRLGDGSFDLPAFSRVVADAARSLRLSRRAVEAIWEGTSGSARRRPHRSSRGQPLARLRPYLAEVAGDFDRAPEAVEDWMIAVWLSAREEGFHDTTVAEPLATLVSAAH